jgi:hypothetical protein
MAQLRGQARLAHTAREMVGGWWVMPWERAAAPVPSGSGTGWMPSGTAAVPVVPGPGVRVGPCGPGAVAARAGRGHAVAATSWGEVAPGTRAEKDSSS